MKQEITTLEVDEPIQDLKGRNLNQGDLVVLADADDLDNDEVIHEVGDIFQFIGGLDDNLGAFIKCETKQRSDFFADRTLKINQKLN
jgi:hypothetical protein